MKLPKFKIVKLREGEKSATAKFIRYFFMFNIIASSIAVYYMPKHMTPDEIKEEADIEKESEILSR
jgi:hypothetical protein